MIIVFGLGIAYFLAAIPTGVALKLSPLVAALCAWAGYTAIGAAMLAAGAPVREWLGKKFRISPHPDPRKFFWRVWLKWGLPGLALLAPVTCGPYIAAIIALALGEKPPRVMFWIMLGVIPWCIGFAIAAAAGVQLLHK